MCTSRVLQLCASLEPVQGVKAPTPATPGFFTVPGVGEGSRNQVAQAPCQPGQFCTGGVAAPCPPGVYGASPEQASPACSGPCAAGYHCPASSTSALQYPCGGEDVFCPAGSGLPLSAAPGMYTVGPTPTTRNDSVPCPGGSYCVGGVQYPCEAGSFGCADRLSTPTCNGPCTAGYFCPAGSTSSRARACGGDATRRDAATWYCLQGSESALRVGPGNYSTGSPDGSPHLRTGQSVCPSGYFCADGVKVRECLSSLMHVFVTGSCAPSQSRCASPAPRWCRLLTDELNSSGCIWRGAFAWSADPVPVRAFRKCTWRDFLQLLRSVHARL
jgi:hypothetical protein